MTDFWVSCLSFCRKGLQRPLDFDDVVGLDYIADLDVVVTLDVDAVPELCLSEGFK